MTNFQLWLKGCEINHTTVCKLEKPDLPETGVYSTISEYEADGRKYFRSRVYFVWVNGKEIYNGSNYHEAIQEWERYGTEMELYGE